MNYIIWIYYNILCFLWIIKSFIHQQSSHIYFNPRCPECERELFSEHREDVDVMKLCIYVCKLYTSYFMERKEIVFKLIKRCDITVLADTGIVLSFRGDEIFPLFLSTLRWLDGYIIIDCVTSQSQSHFWFWQRFKAIM